MTHLRIAHTTGLTYTADIYLEASTTSLETGISLAEDGTSGRYYGTMSSSAVPGAIYDIFYIQNSIIEAAETKLWTGFRLEDPNRTDSPRQVINTSIATVSSQTVFTVTSGSDADDAYNGMVITITDADDENAVKHAIVSDYIGGTKQVTIDSDTALFTTAIGDIASINLAAGSAAEAADIWAYATRTLTSTANVTSSSVSGSRIEIIKGVTFTNTWSGLTIPATWAKIYWTIKEDSDLENDGNAIVQAVITNGGDAGDGLLYLNKSVAATLGDALLTPDQGAGTIIATLADNSNSLLDLRTNLTYDFKVLLSGGTSELPLRKGKCDVVSTATWTI